MFTSQDRQTVPSYLRLTSMRFPEWKSAQKVTVRAALLILGGSQAQAARDTSSLDDFEKSEYH